MTAPAKTNGTSIPKIAREWIGLVVAACALFGVGVIALRPAGRADPWTGSQHTQYEKLVDQRIDHLTRQVTELASLIREHTKLGMHAGAATTFAKIESDLAHLIGQVEKIQRKLDTMDSGPR